MLVGGGAALAVGGWYLFLREGPGPEETVESFYDALDQNDYERANQLLHEHRRRERGRINPVNVREYGFSVQRTTIVGDDPGIRPGRFDGVQTFEVIEAEVVISSGRESISSTENVVVAQTPEGNWKIWSTSTTI